MWLWIEMCIYSSMVKESCILILSVILTVGYEVSFLFPGLQDRLGGFLPLTGNDVQTTGHKSLRSAMSRLGFRLGS